VVLRWWARMALSRLWVAAPWVQFEVGALAAVVWAGAQPGGQLGEGGFGDAGALAVAGFAVGGGR
jgi:hypothetical protein